MKKSLSISITSFFAALYAAVTIVETALGGPLSYGIIQVRVSDALLPLPMIFGLPAAFGLFLGCIVANAYYMLNPLDVLFGSLANLVAGVLSAKLSNNNVLLAATYPVVAVTLIVGSYLPLLIPGVPLWFAYVSVGTGEVIACFIIGIPLLKAAQKAFKGLPNKPFKWLSS